MEASGVVVLEISSDEEGAQSSEKNGSPDCLLELLDDNKDDVTDADVLVVHELSCAPGVPPKNNSMVSDRPKSGSDDDECIILDGDPDRPVDVVGEKKDDSDDLLLVAEKGQLACRDYPHPRHLCATFPFSTTAHEKFCDECHCYVCDMVAPCLYWGSGSSSADHCHSTDKEEKWKLQRQLFKQENITSFQKSQMSSPLRTCSGGVLGTPKVRQRHSQRPAIQCSQTTFRSNTFNPNHVNQIERQTRVLPPRLCSPPCFKRPGFLRPSFPSNHSHRTRQVQIADDVVDTSAYKNQHLLTAVPQSPNQGQWLQVNLNTASCNAAQSPCPPQSLPQGQCIQVNINTAFHPFYQSPQPSVMLPEKSKQYSSAIADEGASLRSFKDVVAGFESDTSLVTTSNSNTLDIPTHKVSSQDDAVRIPIPQRNKSNLTGSQPCMVPSETDLHGQNLDENAVANPATLGPNLDLVDGVLSNSVPHMPVKVQTPAVPPVVANNDLGSEDILGGDWLSIFKNVSTQISHDPDIIPDLSSAEHLMFDFEEALNGF